MYILYYTVQNWMDKFLVWKPEDYGGVHQISLPPSSIWTPDIELYNRLEMFIISIVSDCIIAKLLL